jgi:hypothetical protein
MLCVAFATAISQREIEREVRVVSRLYDGRQLTRIRVFPGFGLFEAPEGIWKDVPPGRVNCLYYSFGKNIDTLSARRTYLVLESFDPLSSDIGV